MKVFEKFFLTSPCSFCSTADDMLPGVLSYQSSHCDATLRMKDRYCPLRCGIPVANVVTVSRCLNQIMKLKIDHILCRCVFIIKTCKFVLAYIIYFENKSFLCITHSLPWPYRQENQKR